MNHIEHKIEIKLSIQEINKETWNELSCLLYTSDAADE